MRKNPAAYLIRKHAQTTRSDRAWKILAFWDEMVPRLLKVYPNDYSRVVETQKRFQAAQGLSDEEAIMAAFEENAHDLARSGGR